MKSCLTTLLLGSVIALSGGAGRAATAPDPLIGTWTLNVAKSTFPGRAPQSQTIVAVYEKQSP
jgi:hypothetical protein